MAFVCYIPHVSRLNVLFAVYLKTRLAQVIRTLLTHPVFGAHAWLEHWRVRVTACCLLSTRTEPRFHVISSAHQDMLMHCCSYLLVNLAYCFDFAIQLSSFYLLLDHSVLCSAVYNIDYCSCLSNACFWLDNIFVFQRNRFSGRASSHCLILK